MATPRTAALHRRALVVLTSAISSVTATAAAAATLSSSSASLDEILLEDLLPPSSPLCGGDVGDGRAVDTAATTTSFTFDFTPSTESSRWSSVNAPLEDEVFLAELRHDDPSGPNRTWTARFGRGGNVYSFAGPYGESIPPQTGGASPWVDEVLQCVAVDLTRNSPADGRSYFIHQAGAYVKDEEYMPPPFYSPTIARHCGVNMCSFASWGTQAHVPTVFRSDLLYIHRYRDCGDGIMEYTQGFQNVGDVNDGAVLDYLNVPWGGVRTSSLPECVLSGPDGTMLEKETPLQWFGKGKKIPNLSTMGGYTTFATDLPVPADKKDLSLPCYKYDKDGAAEVKDPCTRTDVDEGDYIRFRLIFRGTDPCAYFAPHSDRFLGYYVSCTIQGGGGVPRIDGCRSCAGRMRFTNVDTGAYITVTDVVHWTFGNGRTYFSSPEATAEEINALFGDGTEVVVSYDDGGRRAEDSLALTYVHGVDREFEDGGNDWMTTPGRARFGRAGRDYTVFTVNQRLKLEPGSTYFNRQYLITDRFVNIEDAARVWVDETFADMYTGNDFDVGGRRRVELWEEDGVFGVAFAAAPGGASAACPRGSSRCVGSSVPMSGTTSVPFFAIACGESRTYVGPDRYALAPKRLDDNDPIRSYVCDGMDDDDDPKAAATTRPSFTLLGYFPAGEDGCEGVMGARYDPAFCDDKAEEEETQEEEEEVKVSVDEPSSVLAYSPDRLFTFFMAKHY